MVDGGVYSVEDVCGEDSSGQSDLELEATGIAKLGDQVPRDISRSAEKLVKIEERTDAWCSGVAYRDHHVATPLCGPAHLSPFHLKRNVI